MPHHAITRSTRVAGLIAALIALGALAAGCKRTVHVEKALLEKLAEHGIQATVTCPKNQEAKAGATFTCEAVLADGDKLSVLVTQKDDEGNVELAFDGAAIDTNKAIEDAKSKLGAVEITCPKRFVVLTKVGATTSCTARKGDQQGIFEITLKDLKTGVVNWEIKPPAGGS